MRILIHVCVCVSMTLTGLNTFHLTPRMLFVIYFAKFQPAVSSAREIILVWPLWSFIETPAKLNKCTLATSSKFRSWQTLTLTRAAAWWRHHLETFSALLALCEGNPPGTGGLPSQRLVTRSFDFFFDKRLNKPFSKQSRRRWFETSSSWLWRHCSVGVTLLSIWNRNSPHFNDDIFLNQYLFLSHRMIFPKNSINISSNQ